MANDPGLGALIGLQLLHGLTFGATHLGGVHLVSRLVRPDRAATAQALHATVTSGIGMGGAVLIAGQLYGPFAGASYLAMTALCASGLVAALALERAMRSDPSVRF
jgi:PPP family 3-phenylpropionic acid transporter